MPDSHRESNRPGQSAGSRGAEPGEKGSWIKNGRCREGIVAKPGLIGDINIVTACDVVAVCNGFIFSHDFIDGCAIEIRDSR